MDTPEYTYPQKGTLFGPQTSGATASALALKETLAAQLSSVAKMNPRKQAKFAISGDLFIAVTATAATVGTRKVVRVFQIIDAIDQCGPEPPDQALVRFEVIAWGPSKAIAGSRIQPAYGVPKPASIIYVRGLNYEWKQLCAKSSYGSK